MRPEGWKNPYVIVIDGVDIDCSVEAKAFEAGADAYEAGLFKMAKESPTGMFIIDSHTVTIYEAE